ncbi:MAG: hypothetical protein ACN0LA_11145 [Candidatus Longimicrobiales bacterium M2_2A_002]
MSVSALASRAWTVLGTPGDRLRAICTAALAISVPAGAAAQFSVQPAIVQITTGDTTATAVVTVHNEASHPLQLRFYTGDFDQDRRGDHRFLEAGEHERSCEDRLQFYPDGAALEPGEVQEIRMLMEPLDSTCWSMLFVESASPAMTGLRVSQRIGVKVYGLATREVPEGEIRSVEVTDSVSDRALVIAFMNPGRAPVRPEGEIEVRTLDGEVVEVVRVEPFSVLPGRTRETRVPLDLVLDTGIYVLVPVLDFGGDYLAGGQAILEIGRP